MGGPNSEHFLSNLRILLKRGKFFLTTLSLISIRDLSFHKPIYKNLFHIKKRLLDFILGSFFLKTKPGADPEISRRERGELIWLYMVYFMIILAKRER